MVLVAYFSYFPQGELRVFIVLLVDVYGSDFQHHLIIYLLLLTFTHVLFSDLVPYQSCCILFNHARC